MVILHRKLKQVTFHIINFYNLFRCKYFTQISSKRYNPLAYGQKQRYFLGDLV